MKPILYLVLLLTPLWAAAELGVTLEQPDIDVADTPSVRRGLELYVDRCLGCHSLKHLRYRRLQRDLRLSDEEIKALFPHLERIVGTMTTAMDPQDAERWFGVPAPDLSERIRALGADWLYTYLRSFYKDETRPFGVNNRVFPDVAMPHVLWDLQGEQEAVTVTVGDTTVIQKLELVEPGKLSPPEYDKAVADLVNFLAYAAEPAQLERRRIGPYVLLFLFLLAFVTYRLKKAYWKDVH